MKKQRTKGRGGRRRRGDGPPKKSITVVNEARGTLTTIVIDRRTGRLSRRQERETFDALSTVGYRPAGEVGEWPLHQVPPETGEPYVFVRAGRPEGELSNLYFVPVASAEMIREEVESEAEASSAAA